MRLGKTTVSAGSALMLMAGSLAITASAHRLRRGPLRIDR